MEGASNIEPIPALECFRGMLQQFVNVPAVDDVYWTLFVELKFYILFATVVWFGLTYRRVVLFNVIWTVLYLFADVIKFDPGLNRIYVACYSGAIAVFHQDDPDHYRKLEDFHVQHAVHSLAVDPKTHRVYTPEQEEDGKPVARMVVYDALP